MTFATNDERTAKRISETLGTATELRAQRNYQATGSRRGWAPDGVAPGNRAPLLTPGEVMQLPPDEAVVMVSSVAPIKAKKLRYYATPISSAACCRRPAGGSVSTPTRRRSRPTTGAGWRFPPCPPHLATASADETGSPMTAARAVSLNSPKPSPTTRAGRACRQ